VLRRTVRSRRYCFTLNNPTAADIDNLTALPVRYLVFGHEVAPITGTPHLQGFVCWNNAKTLRSTITLLGRCHVELTRGTALQASTYCKKDGNFVERGDLPADPAESGGPEIDRWNTAWDLAKAGLIEEIPADIRIRSYATLKRIGQDYMERLNPLESPCGIWIFGLSGSGKTRAVHARFPDAFIKPCTKWWDGYQGEDVVVVDDLDKYHVALGGELKHWADFMPFITELKGGSRRIRPRTLIVTSQYTIGDIWKDEETREALSRRFKFLEKTKDIPLDWLEPGNEENLPPELVNNPLD